MLLIGYINWHSHHFYSIIPLSLHPITLKKNQTALLRDNWYMWGTAHIYCAVWWVWTHANTHATNVTINVIDIRPLPECACVPVWVFLGVCVWRTAHLYWDVNDIRCVSLPLKKFWSAHTILHYYTFFASFPNWCIKNGFHCFNLCIFDSH